VSTNGECSVKRLEPQRHTVLELDSAQVAHITDQKIHPECTYSEFTVQETVKPAGGAPANEQERC
jgi:hypothetical protein